MFGVQVGLTSFGAFFTFLGVLMFFDGALIALGNVSLCSRLDLLSTADTE